jgi:hypothetical protein
MYCRSISRAALSLGLVACVMPCVGMSPSPSGADTNVGQDDLRDDQQQQGKNHVNLLDEKLVPGVDYAAQERECREQEEQQKRQQVEQKKEQRDKTLRELNELDRNTQEPRKVEYKLYSRKLLSDDAQEHQEALDFFIKEKTLCDIKIALCEETKNKKWLKSMANAGVLVAGLIGLPVGCRLIGGKSGSKVQKGLEIPLPILEKSQIPSTDSVPPSGPSLADKVVKLPNLADASGTGSPIIFYGSVTAIGFVCATAYEYFRFGGYMAKSIQIDGLQQPWKMHREYIIAKFVVDDQSEETIKQLNRESEILKKEYAAMFPRYVKDYDKRRFYSAPKEQ